MWLGIPKPMIPYPLLWEGAVRTVGSHLGRIPNCSEVPDHPPPPHGNPGNPPPPPGTALPGAPPRPPPPSPPPPLPPPLGAFGQQLVGGVVGVQDRGVAPPRGVSCCGISHYQGMSVGQFLATKMSMAQCCHAEVGVLARPLLSFAAGKVWGQKIS